MLRGIELLSSLQNITKPFYLNNLTREQSEDLGRAGEFYITFDFFFFLTFLLCSFLVCTKNRQISKSRSQRMDSIWSGRPELNSCCFSSDCKHI